MAPQIIASSILRKLEGEKAAIGLQANSMASLVIDDPLWVGECFFEQNVRFTKTELQEIVISSQMGNCGRGWKPRWQQAAGKSALLPYGSQSMTVPTSAE